MNYMAIQKSGTPAKVKPMTDLLQFRYPDIKFIIEPGVNILFVTWTEGPQTQDVRDAVRDISQIVPTRYVK